MIYLDNHATTKCDSRVVDAMIPYFSECYANPSSEFHQMGRDARRAVKLARAYVAALIEAQPNEVVFTSSATESNNLVILGVAEHARRSPHKDTIVITPIEHKSILSPCKVLNTKGYPIEKVSVDYRGCVDIDDFKAKVSDRTMLVAIQAASNEIGSIQNIGALLNACKGYDVLFHCDAVQAAGKIPISVKECAVDYLSISGHKMYGPKGIAALYARKETGKQQLSPIMQGGDQEYGLRPGTLNVPLIVGFGEACRIAKIEMNVEARRIALMRDRMEKLLTDSIPELHINGAVCSRLPNNSSLTFRGIDADALILSMPEVALSSGSACNSGAMEPSYVLRSIGLSREHSQSTLRVGLGRFTTNEEIDSFAQLVIERVRSL